MNLAELEKISFPEMYRVRQKFKEDKIKDLALVIKKELNKVELGKLINPGDTVALTAGSRGITRIADILKIIVEEVKEVGGQPIIIPAMGSHGGATAEGQKKVLAEYNITAEYVGASIKASMETVKIGKINSDLPVFMDKIAYNAEAIIPVNRIKVHTSCQGKTQSGILKMLAIGLGKQKGAATIHSYGAKGLQEYVPAAGKLILEKAPVVLGVGILENAYEDLYKIEAMLPEDIPEREVKLLEEQKKTMPKLPFKDIDILFIDEMGKDISGVGIDTNVIGRMRIKGVAEPEAPDIDVIVVSDLTEGSQGNATGIGLADVITRKLFEKIDFRQTYANILTTTFYDRGKIPVIAENDKMALKMAVKFLGNINYEEAKVIRIKNTLELTELEVSKTFLTQVKRSDNLELLGRSILEFDEKGMLSNL